MVVKYTNVLLGVGESVLFMEVSLVQWCPYREILIYKMVRCDQMSVCML